MRYFICETRTTIETDRVTRLIEDLGFNYEITRTALDQEGHQVWLTLARLNQSYVREIRAAAYGCLFGMRNQMNFIRHPQVIQIDKIQTYGKTIPLNVTRLFR